MPVCSSGQRDKRPFKHRAGRETTHEEHLASSKLWGWFSSWANVPPFENGFRDIRVGRQHISPVQAPTAVRILESEDGRDFPGHRLAQTPRMDVFLV